MKKIVFATLLFLIAGCSSDNDVVDIFIPNVSNQWESDRNSKFFFNPENTDVNESNFIGSEQTSSDNFEFTGFFKNYDIEFTFTEGAEQGVKYTGRFIKGSNPLRIEVNGTNKNKIKITQVLLN